MYHEVGELARGRQKSVVKCKIGHTIKTPDLYKTPPHAPPTSFILASENFHRDAFLFAGLILVAWVRGGDCVGRCFCMCVCADGAAEDV